MESVQARIKNAYKELKGDFGYKNPHQAPAIEKVVISVGTGRVDDKAKIALIQDRLAKITGQKASPRPAKQSIASFKLREGEIIGYQVTLRGARRDHFLDKLIHIAIPQIRDFRVSRLHLSMKWGTTRSVSRTIQFSLKQLTKNLRMSSVCLSLS